MEEDENGGLFLLEGLMQEEENEVSSFGFGEEMARNNAKLCLMLFISSLDKLEYPFDGHVGQAKRCHIWVFFLLNF